MRNLLSDVRFGLRILSKYPGFSALSIIAVGLGLYLVIGQLLVIHAFLFRGLPVENEHLVQDITLQGGMPGKDFHPEELAGIADRQQSFETIGGFYEGTVNLGDAGTPCRLNGAFISWNFLDVLGVQPERGRAFTRDDSVAGAAPVVLLSHRAWTRDFRGDPTIVGRSVLINSQRGTVIGVLPPGIRFPLRQEAWVPLRTPMAGAAEDVVLVRGFGRLKKGVSARSAQAELSGIAASLAVVHPERWEGGQQIAVTRFSRAFVPPDTVRMLWIMFAAVICVLLIACANVANLLLARSAVRGRELAVRAAVGAPRLRLIRQMLVESLVICVAGGLLGAAGIVWTMESLQHLVFPEDQPFWFRMGFSWSVAGAVFGLTVVSALLAGIVPAVKASRTDVIELLKEMGRSSGQLHVGMFSRALIGVQVAMSFALLLVAGLMIRTVSSLDVRDVPFDPETIVTARFGLFAGDFPSRDDRHRFLDSLERQLVDDPSIAGAAITNRPQFESHFMIRVEPLGGGDPMDVLSESVSSGYFNALGVPVKAGRAFEPADIAEARRVVVVNESFVRHFAPDGNAVGRAVVLKGEREAEPYTIVGVVPDLRMNGVGASTQDEAGLYLPLSTDLERFFTVVVRPRGGMSRAVALLHETVRKLEPNLPLYWVQTYREAIDQTLSGWVLATSMFLVFGVAAAALAGIGIYGVVSFTVRQRTPEIGIRMALGAQGRGIVFMILRQGAVQLVTGLLAGTLLALVMAAFLRKYVAGIDAVDVASFVFVGLAVSLMALLSSWMPAQRAVRLTPLAALRHE